MRRAREIVFDVGPLDVVERELHPAGVRVFDGDGRVADCRERAVKLPPAVNVPSHVGRLVVLVE